MIRFRRLFDIITEHDHMQTMQIREMFGTAFPAERQAAQHYLDHLHEQHSDYETVILIAENGDGKMVGFSLSIYFPGIRYAGRSHRFIPDHPQRHAGNWFTHR